MPWAHVSAVFLQPRSPGAFRSMLSMLSRYEVPPPAREKGERAASCQTNLQLCVELEPLHRIAEKNTRGGVGNGVAALTVSECGVQRSRLAEGEAVRAARGSPFAGHLSRAMEPLIDSTKPPNPSSSMPA